MEELRLRQEQLETLKVTSCGAVACFRLKRCRSTCASWRLKTRSYAPKNRPTRQETISEEARCVQIFEMITSDDSTLLSAHEEW